jgi:hypothetical protein
VGCVLFIDPIPAPHGSALSWPLLGGKCVRS